MPQQAPSKAHERERLPQAETASRDPARRPAPPGPYADILALQDAAGNQAVSQLLQPNADEPALDANGIPPIVEDVLKSGGGQPLDPATRSKMEEYFGTDFGQVRIHTDGIAVQSVRAANSSAYAAGNHLVFDTGHYAPESAKGQRLIAHELTHVVQQRGNSANLPDIAHEHEAEIAATKVQEMAHVSVTNASAVGVPQFATRSNSQPMEKPRKIYPDATVIISIEEGNSLVEPKIAELREQGHQIKLAQQVFNEVVGNAGEQWLNPQKAEKRVQLLRQLGFKITKVSTQDATFYQPEAEEGARGQINDRIDVHAANEFTPSGKLRVGQFVKNEIRESPILSVPDPMKTLPKGKRNDILVAAEIAAADGEIWTTDRAYLKIVNKTPVGAKPEITKPIDQGGLGLRVAPESWEIPQVPPPSTGKGSEGSGGTSTGGLLRETSTSKAKQGTQTPEITPKTSASAEATTEVSTVQTPPPAAKVEPPAEGGTHPVAKSIPPTSEGQKPSPGAETIPAPKAEAQVTKAAPVAPAVVNQPPAAEAAPTRTKVEAPSPAAKVEPPIKDKPSKLEAASQAEAAPKATPQAGATPKAASQAEATPKAVPQAEATAKTPPQVEAARASAAKAPPIGKQALKGAGPSLGGILRSGPVRAIATQAAALGAGLALSYLNAKLKGRIEEKWMARDIARLEPTVVQQLEASLRANAEQLAQLCEKYPQATVYVYRNITYKYAIAHHSPQDPDMGDLGENWYRTTELVSAEISTSPISTEPSILYVEFPKGFTDVTDIMWYSLPTSEPIPASELFTEK